MLKNAGSLYAVQLASFIIPLAEIPVLARAFGPTLYGQIVFCQALALALSIVVEYGFNINAAQQLAVCRDNQKKIGQLFSDVLCAKLILFVAILLVLTTSLAQGALWAYIGTTQLLLFVFCYFLAFSFSPMWFFQGQERMSGVALLDVVLRLIGLLVLISTVHSPEDFTWALLLLALPPLLNTVATLYLAKRQAGVLSMTWRGGWQQLTQGFHFFIYRSANSLVAATVPVALGLVSGKRAVGEFAPPEKLVKGMGALALPFLMAVFPAFSRRFGVASQRASFKTPLLTLGVIAVLSWVGCIAGVALAPWILEYMLGQNFLGALAVFHILVWCVPFRIMNQSMVFILLMPAGYSKWASYLTSAFAIVSLAIGMLAAMVYGGEGMAAALLAGEVVLFLALAALTLKIVRGGGAGSLPSLGNAP